MALAISDYDKKVWGIRRKSSRYSKTVVVCCVLAKGGKRMNDYMTALPDLENHKEWSEQNGETQSER